MRAWIIAMLALSTTGMPTGDTRAQPVDNGAAILGSQAAACAEGSGRTALLVTISGINGYKGILRLDLYSDDPATFLAGKDKTLAAGKLFQRLHVPVPESGEPRICIELPGPGRYALFVLHDKNGNDAVNVFSDGFGFSNNPKIGLFLPKVKSAAFSAGPGVQPMPVHLSYYTSRSRDSSMDRRE